MVKQNYSSINNNGIEWKQPMHNPVGTLSIPTFDKCTNVNIAFKSTLLITVKNSIPKATSTLFTRLGQVAVSLATTSTLDLS